MTTKDRDLILKLTRENYRLLGCVFPEDTRELVEYLSESQHGDEIRSLQSAINAHNLYKNDNINMYDFFDWHGL